MTKKTDSKTTSPKPPEQVTVTLKKDHTHAGKQYKAGKKLEVPETTIQWLRERGVIQ